MQPCEEMNITKSEEVVVLYHVEHAAYGWRWASEYLPKRAAVFATIALVDKKATAIIHCSPSEPLNEFLEINALVTKKFAESMESGAFTASLRDNNKQKMNDVAMGLLLCSISETPLVDFLTVAEEIDDYERLLCEPGSEDLAMVACAAIQGAHTSLLDEHKDICARLLRVLPQAWRFNQLCTIPEPGEGIGPRWSVLVAALTTAFPDVVECPSS
jgi:hypothetical protein